MHAVPYLRWSSDKQQSGSTIPRQTETITAYAVEKGWQLPPESEWLRDEGVSGFKGHNLSPAGALGKFTDLTCREGGHGAVLLVEQLDRLSRKTPRRSVGMVFKVTHAGLTVALCDNKMIVDQASLRNQADQLRALLDDSERANNETARRVVLLQQAWAAIRDGMDVRVERPGTVVEVDYLASVANPADVGIDITMKTRRSTDTYELSTLADGFAPLVGDFFDIRTLLGRVARKVHTSSTCPAWLALSPCRRFFEPIPEKVAVVQRIFELYASGVAKVAITRILNGDGVPTFRAGDGWGPSSVKALIDSRAVIGEYQHKSRAQDRTFGDPIPDYFPAIISNQLWQAACAPRSGHKREGRGRSILVRNLFSDIARCESCGSKMYFLRKPRKKTGVDDAYLQCSNYFLNKTNADGSARCTDKMMWHYRPLVDALLDTLLSSALDDQHFSNDAEIAAINAQMADQKRAVEDIGTQLDNLVDNMAGSTSERLRVRFDALEKKEAKAKADLVALEEQMAVARGRVDPSLHIKRVAAIREEIDRDNDDGLKARITIKNALNGLISKMQFDSGAGFVNITLLASQRYIAIAPDGGVVRDMDLNGRKPTDAEKPFLDAYKRRKATG
ncbi:recombinase family protein [Sphingomonas aerolata]|uniref:recombinase family protein n=1 Tax=Sphingomonas aerolata TaxID=185951 RepID=UPI002FE29112